MTIGEKIYKLRTEKGMTQDELALAVGYKSRSTIAKIESGERDPYQSMVVALAKALGTTPSYLMGWENKQNENALDDAKSVEELLKEKKTKEKWDAILDELSQENRDRLQEQAVLLLLKQQVQADQESFPWRR